MLIETLLGQYMRKLGGRILAFQENHLFKPEPPPLGKSCFMYIHIPFCEQLCPYCSFNRVLFEETVANQYFEALKKEIEIYHNAGFRFESVYVGGGTPTIVPDKLADILNKIRTLWPINEISVETNPNHLTKETTDLLKKAGVNRLSVGVQTFNNKLLANIGRLDKYGSGQEIKERISSIIGVFDTLNIDLIFNLPNQSRDMLLDDIDIINTIKTDQVTFYPLMPSSIAKDKIRNELGRISLSKEKELYTEIIKSLSNDYVSSSAWCFSRKKGMIDEYIINHKEYAGIGSGALGYINGTIYSNTFSIQEYIDLLQKDSLPIVASKTFSKTERMYYYFLTSLFGTTLNIKDVAGKYGSLFWLFAGKVILFFIITRAGTLTRSQMNLTPKGKYYMVVLMREFFISVNNFRAHCLNANNSKIPSSSQN